MAPFDRELVVEKASRRAGGARRASVMPDKLPSHMQRLLSGAAEKGDEGPKSKRRQSSYSSLTTLDVSQVKPPTSSRRSSLSAVSTQPLAVPTPEAVDHEEPEPEEPDNTPPSTVDEVTDKEHFTYKLALSFDDAANQISAGQDAAEKEVQYVLRDVYKLLMPMAKIDKLLEMQQMMDDLRQQLYPAVKKLTDVAQEQIQNAKSSMLNYNKMQAFARKWSKMNMWKAWRQWKYYMELIREEDAENWKRDAVQRVVKRWMNQELGGAFAQWKENTNKAAIRKNAESAVARAEREKLQDLQHRASMVEELRREKEKLKIQIEREKEVNKIKSDEIETNTQQHKQDIAKAKFDAEFQSSMEQKKLQERLKEERANVMKLNRKLLLSEEATEALRQQQIKKILIRMMRKELVTAFEAWKEQFKNAKQNKHKMNVVVRRMIHGLMSGVWSRWKEMVEESRDIKRKLKKAAMKMMNRALVVAFEGWKETTVAMVEQRRMLMQVAKRVMNRELAMAFKTWVDNVSEARHLINILHKAARKLMASKMGAAWNRWKEMWEETRELKAKMNKIIKRIANSKLAGAWSRWLEVTAEARRLRVAAERVVKRMKNSCLSAAFAKWVEFWSEEKEAAERRNEIALKALTRVMNRCLSMAFERWIDFIEGFRELKTKGLKVIAMIKRRTEVLVFRAWAGYIRDLKQEQEDKMEVARRYFLKIYMGIVATCFHDWLDLVRNLRAEREEKEREEREAREEAERIEREAREEQERIEREEREAREAAEAEAKRIADEKREERTKRVVMRMLRKHLAQAFSRWIDRVAEEKKLRVKMKAVAARMVKRCVNGAFNRWKEMAYETKVLRHRMNCLMKRLLNSSMVAAFNSWYEAASTARQTRINAVLDNNRVRYAKCEVVLPLLECTEEVLQSTLKLIRGRDDILNHKSVIDATKGILKVLSWGMKYSPLTTEQLTKLNADKPMSHTQRRKDPHFLFTTNDVTQAVDLGVDLMMKEFKRLQIEVERLSTVCKNHARDITTLVDSRKEEHNKMSALMRQKLVALYREGEDKLMNRLQKLAYSMNTSNWFNWLSEMQRTTAEEVNKAIDSQHKESKENGDKLPLLEDSKIRSPAIVQPPVVAASTSLYFPPFHASGGVHDRNSHHIGLPFKNFASSQHSTPSTDRTRRIASTYALYYSDRSMAASSPASQFDGRAMTSNGGSPPNASLGRMVPDRPSTVGHDGLSRTSKNAGLDKNSLSMDDGLSKAMRGGSGSPIVTEWGTGLPIVAPEPPPKFFPHPPNAVPSKVSRLAGGK